MSPKENAKPKGVWVYRCPVCGCYFRHTDQCPKCGWKRSG